MNNLFEVCLIPTEQRLKAISDYNSKGFFIKDDKLKCVVCGNKLLDSQDLTCSSLCAKIYQLLRRELTSVTSINEKNRIDWLKTHNPNTVDIRIAHRRKIAKRIYHRYYGHENVTFDY
jgi:hypothetical protein